jgi:O-antigen/teichoic acid export membrane protein
VAPINRAIFPGYAKMAQELGMLRQGFINVISAIALFAIPVCIGIALLADPLVHVMLGEKWLNAIPLVQILSISGLTAALQTNKSSIYLAMGRPRILTFVYTIQLVVSIPLIIFGTMYYKELGAALAILTASLFLMPINYFILFSVLKLNPFKFLETLWRPAVASSIMTMTTLIALNFFPDNGNFFVQSFKIIGFINCRLRKLYYFDCNFVGDVRKTRNYRICNFKKGAFKDKDGSKVIKMSLRHDYVLL